MDVSSNNWLVMHEFNYKNTFWVAKTVGQVISSWPLHTTLLWSWDYLCFHCMEHVGGSCASYYSWEEVIWDFSKHIKIILAVLSEICIPVRCQYSWCPLGTNLLHPQDYMDDNVNCASWKVYLMIFNTDLNWRSFKIMVSNFWYISYEDACKRHSEQGSYSIEIRSHLNWLSQTLLGSM